MGGWVGLPCTQGYTARVHRFEDQLELERGRTEAARSAGASATSQEVCVCARLLLLLLLLPPSLLPLRC